MPEYVNSNSLGVPDGLGWATAWLTVQAGLTSRTAGVEVWVEKAHNETVGGNIVLTCPTDTAIDPCVVISIDSSDNSYAIGGTTNFQLDSGGSFIIDWDGFFRVRGITWYASRPEVSGTGHSDFEDCYVKSNIAHYALYAVGTTSRHRAIFRKATFENIHASGGSFICTGSLLELIDCKQIGNLAASFGLLTFLGAGAITARNCDFSGATFLSGTDVIADFAASDVVQTAIVDGCKLHSSRDGSYKDDVNSTNCSLEVINSDSGGDLSRYEKYDTLGSTVWSTSVYRDSGYSDESESAGVSYEMTSGANVDTHLPIVGAEIIGFVRSTGSKTVTVEIVTDKTSPTDLDVQLELSVQDVASSTDGTLISSAPVGTNEYIDYTAAGTALTSSSEAWTGAAGLTKYKLEVTFTANRVGPIYGRIIDRTYEACKSLYYDPVGLAVA